MRAAALSIGIFMMTGVASAIPVLLGSPGSVRPLHSLLGAIVSASPGSAIGNALCVIRAFQLFADGQDEGQSGVTAAKARSTGGIDFQAEYEHAAATVPEPGLYVLAVTGVGTQPFVPRRLGPIPFF